jgi:F-type H+-transporting ATPase subunit epsilon
MPSFNLEIVTPEKTVYSGQVASLQAPGSEGSFGVLTGHQPMLTSLQIGLMRFVVEGGDESKMAVSGGFAEVGREQVTVLAETAEFAEEIDIDRARAAHERAQERLGRKGDSEIDAVRAEAALLRAMNRLRIVGAH